MPDRQKKRILVVAHPRSGTQYCAALLQAFGLDVGHETEMGADGLVSWIAAAENPRWGPDPNHYAFHLRCHMVRHPIKAISSAFVSAELGVLEYMDRVCAINMSVPPLVRAVRRYIDWHNRIQNVVICGQMFRVEDAPGALSAILKKPIPKFLPPKRMNCREEMMRCKDKPRPADVPLEAFKLQVPTVYLDTLADIAREYGYGDIGL